MSVMLDRLTPALRIAERDVRFIGEAELRPIALHWASLPSGKIGNQTKRVTTDARRFEYHVYKPHK